MPLPTLSREDIELIKLDLKETMRAAEQLNINITSLVRQKILLLAEEDQELYWNIFLYMRDNNG
jgi:hypothetical protein